MEYLQEIGLDHPLMGLIRRCLSNAPASRPEAAEILRQIEVVASHLPPSFENKVEMIQRAQSQNESEVRRNENESRVEEIESQRRQIEVQIGEIESKAGEIESQRRQIEVQRGEIGSKTGEIESQRRQLEVQRGENASQRRQLEVQRDQIQSKTREVESQRTQILSFREQLERLSIPLSAPSTVEPPPPFPVQVRGNIYERLRYLYDCIVSSEKARV